MTEITLAGITTAQKNAMIWAYQVDGSFTSDEFKACWNVRTLFALQHKRVILFNPSTGHYYFNPDYAREIRAKLESWGVSLCDYADDFGAWFDAHIESARQPDSLPEPPADPEDTPILPMNPISDDDYDGVFYGGGSDDETLPGEEESRLEDGFLFNKDVRTAYFEDVPDFDAPIQHGGGGGSDESDVMRVASARANARYEYAAAKDALDAAISAFNSSRGWELIGAMESMRAAQDRYERAAAEYKRQFPSGGGGGVARCPRCHSEKLLFAGKDSDPIDGEMSIYFCLSCGAKYGEFEDDEPKPDPLAWTKHFRPDPAKVRSDYNAGYLYVRKMTGQGWTKQEAFGFAYRHFGASNAFFQGCLSYVYRDYRDSVRYFNDYHWQNEIARLAFENRQCRPVIDRIPF